MKSKHNNIDKLFAEKLSTLEGRPSAEAWMALEKGLTQKQKKKKGVWLIYSAAAAVALIIVSFLWFYQQPDSITIATHPTTLPEKNKATGKQTEIINPSSNKEQINKEIANPVINQPDKLIAQTTITQKEEQVKGISTKVTKKAPQIRIVPEKQPEVKVIMPTVSAEEQIATLDVQPDIVPATALSNTIVVKVELEETNEAAFAGEEIAEEPGKQTKAGKLLDKLIKLKKGEFNQLGMKPETLVAFVKEKANNALSNNHNDK